MVEIVTNEAADKVVADATEAAGQVVSDAAGAADRVVAHAAGVADSLVAHAADVATAVTTEQEDAAGRVTHEAVDVADRMITLAAGTADEVTNKAVDVAGRVVTLAQGEAIKVQFEAADVANRVVMDAAAARMVIAEAAEKLTDHVKLLTASVTASNREVEILGDQLGDNNKRIDELGTYGERNRVWIMAVATSLFASVCLTFGLGFALTRATSASNTAKNLAISNRNSLSASCRNGNTVRSKDIVLWTHIIGLIPDPSPSQRATDADLLAFVNKTFAPQKCP